MKITTIGIDLAKEVFQIHGKKRHAWRRKNSVKNDIFWKVSAFKTDQVSLKLTNFATEP